MKTIDEYLKQALVKAKNHTELGKALGVTQQHATRFMNQQQSPSAKTARRLAKYIGEKESVVVIAAEIAREKDKETQNFWKNLGKFLTTTGVIGVIGVSVVVKEEKRIVAENATNFSNFPSDKQSNDLYYVK